MSKLAIQWHDENDVLVVCEFDEAIAAQRVLQGLATWVDELRPRHPDLALGKLDES